MCGIVGAVSAKDSTPFLLEGLATLEYRGYDSAGLALLSSEGVNGLQRARSKGRVAELASKVAQEGLSATATRLVISSI
jgi:glucosamine--fructose-6-phosphate aminotransferase (isomerizing)